MKTVIPRFKVVLYRYNRDFDIYDEVDFNGESLKDPDIEERIPDPETLNKNVDEFIKQVNSVYDSLQKLAKSNSMEFRLIPGPGELRKTAVLSIYLYEYLKDKHKYYVAGTSDQSISWKFLPTTINRMTLAEPYNAYFKKKYAQFIKDFFKDDKTPKSLSELIDSGIVSEYDITDAVVSISDYEISASDLSFTITFTLNVDALHTLGCPSYLMEGNVIDFYVDFYGDSVIEESFYIGEYYGPSTRKELISYLAGNYDESSHTRRFLGVITSVNYSISPRSFPTCSITCSGLSGFLARFNIVKDRALLSFFEEYPFDLPQPGPTPFVDVLNEKNFDQVFDYVAKFFYLTDELPKEEDKLLNSSSNLVLTKENRLFEVAGLTFIPPEVSSSESEHSNSRGISLYRRHNPDKDKDGELRLTSVYTTTFLYFKVREKFKPDLLKELVSLRERASVNAHQFSTKEFEQIQAKYFELARRFERVRYCDICAWLEGNSYTVRAYSLQIKRALAVFYNTFSTSSEILKTLESLVLLHIFEDEPGTLVCRFPRVNNIYNDSRFIISQEDILEMSWSRNDFDLLVRQDYSPVFPIGDETMVGVWNFTDPQILVKYGPKFAEKATHPMASLFHLSYLSKFCAVILGWKNASTRTLELSVVNRGQRYVIGRSYFIPDLFTDNTGWVGLLHKISYKYSIEREIPTILLSFIFVRRTTKDSLPSLSENV